MEVVDFAQGSRWRREFSSRGVVTRLAEPATQDINNVAYETAAYSLFGRNCRILAVGFVGGGGMAQRDSEYA